MTTQANNNKGTFLQLPDVFIETCDLPESAQILFVRLWQNASYKGYFLGSIRKLAKVVRQSKSTVDRMLKVLKDSPLIGIEPAPDDEQDRTVMKITIHVGWLWEANQQYITAKIVPIWDNYNKEKKVKHCPNLGRTVPEKDNLSHDGTLSPNLGRTVPDSSSKVPPYISKTILDQLDISKTVGASAPVVTDQHTSSLFPENELPPLETTEPEKPVSPTSPNGQKPTKPERPAGKEKGKGKGNVTNDPPASKPKGLDAHTDQERAFWALWLNADQNKKVPPQYKDSASDHIKTLAPQITTQEQMDSLTKFARKQLSQQLGREVWRVQLGNLRASFPDWDREQQKENKPASTSPATTETKPDPKQNLILWSKTIEDMPLIEQFKHTRRGRVDEWEALRDQIHWEYVTVEEAMQCGWEEGRVFSDRETRELFAAKERMKELASAS